MEKEFLKSYTVLSRCHLASTGCPAHLDGFNGAIQLSPQNVHFQNFFLPQFHPCNNFLIFLFFSFTEVISVVNASSTSELHPATTLLDDVTETEFVGGTVKEEGDGRSSPDGRNGRPSHDGRVKEGRSRVVGRREEGTMTEMVVDLIKFNID